MVIYGANGTAILDLVVDDSSYAYAEIMNRDDVTLEFALAEYVEIPTGSYIVFEGKTYWLFKPATVTVVNRRNFGYTATFETDIGKLAIWRVKNPVDGHVKFPLTARPSQHLQLFVDCLNAHEPSNIWAVAQGSYDNEGKEITLSYNRTTIRDAVTQLANACETEWELVRSNGTIYLSLGKVEYNAASPIPLSYGEDGGFESGVKRTNAGGGLPIEVLYVQGGNRNIDPSTYFEQSSTLLLPRSYSFSFDGEHFSGEAGYTPAKAIAMVTDAHGYSVRLASAGRGAAEETLDLSDIYPKREGTVSAVETEDSDGDYPFYNVVDDALGTAAGKLDIDYESLWIAGEQKTIVFQSGMLAGREIGIHEFVLEANRGVFKLAQEEIDGFIMPGEGGFIPAVGNKYAIFGCALPAAYIADSTTHTGAEFDMLRKAAKYVYENCRAKQSFRGVLSKVYARKNWTTLGAKIVLGGYVSFSDTDVQGSPVAMRIMSIKRYVNDPYKPELELSDEATKGTVGSSIQTLVNNQAHTDREFYNARGYTNRSFRDAQEAIALLQEAIIEGFGDSISPITVQTMGALVGSERLQYEFTDSTYSTIVDRTPTFNDSGALVCSAGYIKHFTLGFSEADYVKLNRPATEYYRWTITAQTFSFTDTAPRYLYISASKPASRATAGTATYLLSTSGKIPFEPTTAGANYDTSHYYLLFAIISSEIEGTRSVATYNGYTEVTPGILRAMKFISTDGQQFIDFVNKTFRIGDSSKFLGYNIDQYGNVDGNGVLRLKGTMVQSPSGDLFPTPCHRGAYASGTTYYYGDEVTNGGESWLHIGTSATTGVAPGSDDAVWRKTAAKGEDGTAGQASLTSTLFVRMNGTPTKPGNGDGSFAEPSPATIAGTDASGNYVRWSDGIPSGGEILWATRRLFTSDGLSPQQSSWSDPRQMTDTETFDVEFAYEQANDAAPANPSASNRHKTDYPYGYTGQVWFDPELDKYSASGVARDFTTVYWRAERECVNGVWGSWTIARIKGERGDDGVSVLAQYSVDGSTNWHTTFAEGDMYMRTSSDGGEHWGDAMPIVGEQGAPGDDGAPGPYTDYSFAYSSLLTTSSPTTAPSDVQTWSDAPPTPVADKYLWMRVRAMEYDPEDSGADANGYIVTSTTYARIGGEKGTDGKKGKAMRGPRPYEQGGTYQGLNDATGDFYDIVMEEVEGGQAQFYQCTYSSYGGSTAGSTASPSTNPNCWEALTSFDFVATRALAADQAAINDLTIRRLHTQVSGEEEININSVEISENNMKISDGTGENKILISSGSLSPDSAPTGASYSVSASGSIADRTFYLLQVASMSITSGNNAIHIPAINFEAYTGDESNIVGGVQLLVYLSNGTSNVSLFSDGSTSSARDSFEFKMPAKAVTLSEGTWVLYAHYTYSEQSGSVTFNFASSAKSNTDQYITVTYYTSANLNELAGDGWRSVWTHNTNGKQGFEASAGGAVVVQNNNKYHALAGSLASSSSNVLKRVELVPAANYPPATPQDGVLYLKIS